MSDRKILTTTSTTISPRGILFRLGQQNAWNCTLGTTVAGFIRFSSNFAGWWNFVFQTILCSFCSSILKVFGGKWHHKIDSKIQISTNDVTNKQFLKKILGTRFNDRIKCEKKFLNSKIKADLGRMMQGDVFCFHLRQKDSIFLCSVHFKSIDDVNTRLWRHLLLITEQTHPRQSNLL